MVGLRIRYAARSHTSGKDLTIEGVCLGAWPVPDPAGGLLIAIRINSGEIVTRWWHAGARVFEIPTSDGCPPPLRTGVEGSVPATSTAVERNTVPAAGPGSEEPA